MRLGNVTLAASLFAGVALLCSAVAAATTITFSGLSGTNGTPVASYSESGYTLVTLIGGQFFEGLIFGNPAPSLIAGPVFGGPQDNTLNIFDGGSFNFVSFDLAANNGDTAYGITGVLAGNQQYSFNATEPGHTGVFTTIFNPFSGIAVDQVFLNLFVLGSSANIDNIVANAAAAVPEPTSILLLGGALAGMAMRGRRKNARSAAC
ncbi:MAG: PEP-CTERM sorting domain-containing protein [Alphaproteobacteria bacterium]